MAMIAERADKAVGDTSKRKYPVPPRPWLYFQQWRETVVLHWTVDAQAIANDLPPGVSLDTFEGKAWISLVLFSVDDFHIRKVPTPKCLGRFEEINLRTYVIGNGLPGIYLLAVETDKRIVQKLLKFFSRIPYSKAEIKRADSRISSRHPAKGFELDIDYEPAKLIQRSALDDWLTERHCLFVPIGSQWYRYDIHHQPWRLQLCRVDVKKLKYHTAHIDLAGRQPEQIHYSKTLDVLLWPRRKFAKM